MKRARKENEKQSHLAPYKFRVDGTQVLKDEKFKERAKQYEKFWELKCFLGEASIEAVQCACIPLTCFVISAARFFDNDGCQPYIISIRNGWSDMFNTYYRKSSDFFMIFKEFERKGYIPFDRSEHPLFRDAAQKRTREAILEWTKCALRLKLPRDLRNLIAREMWRERKLWIL